MVTYKDPVKQIAREKQREYIAKHLKFRKPQDIQVVCFPGAEVEGQEALEVKEIYDPLGIPRRNIVGLERDRKKFERLHKANLGIQLYNQNDHEFFESTPHRFDVISLDYCGHQNDNVIKSLKEIAGRKLFGNFGVLMTNFNAQRESKKIQNQMFSRYIHSVDSSGFEDLSRQLYDVLIKGGSFELEKIREVLTHETIRLLNDGEGKEDLGFIAAHPYKDQVNPPNTGTIQTFFEVVCEDRQNEGKPIWDSFEEFKQDMVQRGFFNEGFFTDGHGKGTLQREHSELMQHYLEVDLGVDSELASTIILAGIGMDIDGYVTSKIERYNYISQGGSAMSVDLFYVDRNDRKFRNFQNLVTIGRDDIVRINPHRYSSKKFRRQLAGCGLEIYRFTTDQNVPEREFLGSSYKPKEKISKEDAIVLLKGGSSPKDIAELYSGFSAGQLAAFKAHITMGTYD